jgi:hypothetical protein
MSPAGTCRRSFATAALAAALLFPLAACSDDAGPTGPSTGTAEEVPPNAQVVAFDVVGEVTTPVSGIRDARRSVIIDSTAWQALWEEFQGNVIPPPPAPEIDFSQRMTIVATLGTRPDGGYSVAIPEVARDGDVLYVVVEEGIAGIECVTTDEVTSPAVAITVPRAGGEVRFVERETAYPCAPVQSSTT